LPPTGLNLAFVRRKSAVSIGAVHAYMLTQIAILIAMAAVAAGSIFIV
jgi:hypothetical protein